MNKYIYPEKIHGIGLQDIDKVINALAMVGPDDTALDNMKVTKAVKKRLEKELELGPDHPQTNYKTKLFLDIKNNYPKGKMPIFKVAKTLYEKLQYLDRDIPSNHLETNGDIYYFLLSDNYYEGVFVDTFNRSSVEGKDKDGNYIDDVDMVGLRMFFTPKQYSIVNVKAFVFLITGEIFSYDDLVVKKSFENGQTSFKPGEQLVATDEDIDLFRNRILGVLNTLTYINSKDSDIEQLRPIKNYNKKQISTLPIEKKESLATVPIKLVGWSFHGRQYSKGESQVNAHLRWQPCGEGRKDIKLIWVKPHIRRYNN